MKNKLFETQLSTFCRKSVDEIVQLFQTLNGITDNLSSKLKQVVEKQAQQMLRIHQSNTQVLKSNINQLEQTLKEKQKLIMYYENESNISGVIQKNRKLEAEVLSLYERLKSNQKNMQNMKIQSDISNSELLRIRHNLSAQIKDKLFDRLSYSCQKSQIKLKQSLSHANQKHKTKPLISITPFTLEQITNNHIHTEDVSNDLATLKLQIKDVKKHNQKLIQMSPIQIILNKCVEQFKKSIAQKNRVNYTFQDFKKEDKINFIQFFLSNEQVLFFIYSKLFVHEFLKERKPINRFQNLVHNEKNYQKKNIIVNKKYKPTDQNDKPLPYIRNRAASVNTGLNIKS